VILFVIVGRLGKTLTTSKLIPIIDTKLFEKIYVFKEKRGDPIEGVKYITIPDNLLTRTIFRPRLLRRLYELLQIIYYSIYLHPDVINAYQLVPKGWNGFLAAKISKSICITSMIGGFPELETYLKFKKLGKKINLYVLRHSDFVTTKGITVTEYIIKHGIDPSNISAFNGSINTNIYNSKIEQNRNIDLIFVGTFRELKGPNRFVMIVKALSRLYPDIKAIMLGDGDLYKSTLSLINNVGLEHNIVLKGYVEDTYNYYQQTKIIIMPSQNEGLSTAMLEAMACGCVPIVSNVGCQNEAVKHRYNGFLVENYQDIEKYVYYIKYLLTNPNQLNTMSTRCQNFIERKYSSHAQAEIYSNIISNTLNKSYSNKKKKVILNIEN